VQILLLVPSLYQTSARWKNLQLIVAAITRAAFEKTVRSPFLRFRLGSALHCFTDDFNYFEVNIIARRVLASWLFQIFFILGVN
jgi:hypothetical protein